MHASSNQSAAFTLVTMNSLTATLVFLLANGVFGQYPASISAELGDIYPTDKGTIGLSAYETLHPAEASTYIAGLNSVVLANPTYFPTAASVLMNEGGGGSVMQSSMMASIPDYGYPASLSRELGGIFPTNLGSLSFSDYITAHPAEASTYISLLHSIETANPQYFPSAGGGGGGGGGGSGIPITSSRAQSMVTVPQFTQQPSSSGSGGQDGGSGGHNPLLGSIASGGQQTAASTAQTSNPGQAMHTPVLGLGLSGMAVAGVAGLAAFL